MEHNTNDARQQTCSFKPTLDYQEDRRRLKLHAILRDVRMVLDHDGLPASPGLQRLVALVGAEIAAIARVSVPVTDCYEYIELVSDCLDVEPWDANALWTAHAVTPIQDEAARWSIHAKQASRKSEPKKFYHAKLVRPEDIATALNLTRARKREIFGTHKCALPPITVRKGRFPKETMARLRALSKEVKRTPEYLGDILESQGEAGLHSVIEKRRADIAKWSVGSRKRGRKVDPSNLTNAVKDTAKQLRKSERTIWNRLRTMDHETPEFSVTFAVESCHVCSGIARSVIPEFGDVSSDLSHVSDSRDKLADIGMNEKRGRWKPPTTLSRPRRRDSVVGSHTRQDPKAGSDQAMDAPASIRRLPHEGTRLGRDPGDSVTANRPGEWARHKVPCGDRT